MRSVIRKRITLLFLAFASGFLDYSRVSACTFCSGNFTNRQTLRERSAGATVIVHGTLSDSKFGPDGKGTTDLVITTHLKSDAKLGKLAKLTIPQYLPAIGDTPKEYLLFASVVDGKLDVTGGVPVPPAAIEYVKSSLEQPANDSAKRLAFYFQYLDSAEAAISGDAFLEFAKATDVEITKAAAGFDVAKIRKWLADSATPAERLGVYAVLLGLCGKPGDEKPIQQLLNQSPRAERVSGNLGGLLAGWTLLDAKRGWANLGELAANAKAPFDERLAAIGTIRYFQTTHPKESRREIVAIYRTLVGQGDLADMAVEDLRRWGWWELTNEVVTPFDAPTHKAPIIRQAIVRYALTCPEMAAKRFLDQVRKSDPAVVEKVEEGLKRFAVPKP